MKDKQLELCNKLGIDLFKAIKDKEEENIKRTWNK